MKLDLVPCPKCQEELPGHGYLVKGAELRDDLTFHLECPLGHRWVIIYNAPKFEILFDMGISALLDGYGREAVSSFAAALERFHEFGIKVFLANHKVKRDQTAATWKLVSSQTERQLGAYYYLYLLQFHARPETSSIRVEFRNSVIHKGYIPTLKEALEYAEYVYVYILETLTKMRSSLNSQIIEVCNGDMEEMLAAYPDEVNVRAIAAPTMIWLLGPEEKFGRASFKSALKKQKEEHRDNLENRLSDFDDEADDED